MRRGHLVERLSRGPEASSYGGGVRDAFGLASYAAGADGARSIVGRP